jgi:diguanylate cyclase (GGDEF)-like protein/PAS domain S-box-containing protein
MKIRPGINTLFTIIILYIFFIITLSSLIIGKKGMYNLFELQTQKYFTQSISFAQEILDKKISDIEFATNLVDIPSMILSGLYNNSLEQYLQEKLGNNLDFLIYIPNNKTQDIAIGGFFLYDISVLLKNLQNHILNKNELFLIKEKKNTLVFLTSSKKIIDKNSGEVLGILVGGGELSFQSSFYNAIKKYTNLEEVYLMANNKPVRSEQHIPNQSNFENISLFASHIIYLTKYEKFKFENEPSQLQLAMTTSSDSLKTLSTQLQSDIFKISLIFIFVIIQLYFLSKFLLAQPLIQLKSYAKSLSIGDNKAILPQFYVSQYNDLALYLKKLFSELLFLKKKQEKQYEDLVCIKEKLDDTLKLIDKYVLTTSTDLDGNIIEVSEAFCKLSQYSQEELLGQNHRIMKCENTPEELYKELWERITIGEVWEGEICNMTKNGEPYWTNNIVAPVFENGKIIKYTALREDITNKKMIEQLAIKDTLTSLYNRRYIEEALLNGKKHFVRYGETFSVIFLDIDFFKQVNDTYGHQTGDSVLKEFSHILQSNSRETDKIGRWGGEEFIIYLPKSNLQNAIILAEKLLEKIASHKFETIGHKTASLGVAQFNGDIEQTIKNADDALYRAKELGRNQIQIAQ